MERQRRLWAGEWSGKGVVHMPAPQARAGRISAERSGSTASWAIGADVTVASVAMLAVPAGWLHEIGYGQYVLTDAREPTSLMGPTSP